MKQAEVEARVDDLLSGTSGAGRIARSAELLHGALGLMTILYGPQSTQAVSLTKETELIRNKFGDATASDYITDLAEGALRSIKGDLEAGVVGSLQKTVTGEVLTDLLQLARAVLDEKGDDAKNVAAVLAAALFEDTIRRIATSNGIPHIEKLQDVLTELKTGNILQGAQLGIANSYLSFRNKSLHAQWDQVQRESVASVLGFVEQLLIKQFP